MLSWIGQTLCILLDFEGGIADITHYMTDLYWKCIAVVLQQVGVCLSCMEISNSDLL